MTEWVEAEDLAKVIREWIDLWKLERPSADTHRLARKMQFEQGFATAMSVLVEESGISHRRIWAIMNGEQIYTSLAIADQLLVAMDRFYLLDQLTITASNRSRGPNGHLSTGVCSGCGCSYDERTPGCFKCRDRHEKRRARAKGLR